MTTIRQSIELHDSVCDRLFSLPSSWQCGYVVAEATVARASIQGGLLQGATWLCVCRTDWSNVTIGHRMESALIFLPLPPFLYGPDNLLIPILPILWPWRRFAPPSISDLVHLAQCFITSRAHNVTHRPTATIANLVTLIITFAALLSSINDLDSLPTRHNNSFTPFAFVTLDPFTLTHPIITLTFQGSAFLVHLSATHALSSVVSGYLSSADHRISITFHSGCSPTTPPTRFFRVIDDLRFCAMSILA